MPNLNGFTGFGGLTVYSDVFEAQADAAVFNFDALYVGDPCEGGSDLTVYVEHRNSDETSFSSAGNSGAISSTGPFSVDVTGLKQQIRLKVVFAGECTDPDTGWATPSLFCLKVGDIVWYQEHP